MLTLSFGVNLCSCGSKSYQYYAAKDVIAIDFDNDQHSHLVDIGEPDSDSQVDLEVDQDYDSDLENQSPNLKTTSFKYYSAKYVDVDLDDDQLSSQVDIGKPDSDGEGDEQSYVGDVGKVGGEPHTAEEISPYSSIGRELGADTSNIQWSKRFWDLLSPLTTKSSILSSSGTYCDMAELINSFTKTAGRNPFC